MIGCLFLLIIGVYLFLFILSPRNILLTAAGTSLILTTVRKKSYPATLELRCGITCLTYFSLFH